MHSIVIFASGKGSNAAAIIEHFKPTGLAKIALIVSSKADAGVVDIARQEHIPFLVVDKHSFRETLLIDQLQTCKPTFIVLAGFLWKIPPMLLQAFPGRFINIHPALLPGYGGKGMYGSRVHAAVLAAREPESGITIHYVNEVYDNGHVILQARCKVYETDTPATLAERTHHLEHFYYPRAIEYLIKDL